MKNAATTPRVTKEGNLFFPAKPKTETVHPWIGDIFGIPAPSYTPDGKKKKMYRYVLELLYMDFTTDVFTTEGPDVDIYESSLRASLRNVAHGKKGVIAYHEKVFIKDETTGEFKRSKDLDTAAYKKTDNIWRWYPANGNTEDAEFYSEYYVRNKRYA